MTRYMAKKIIEDEELIHYDFFEGNELIRDEIVIYKEAGKWIVFATSERGGMVTNSDMIFDNEEDALDNFIFRLRAMNSYLRRELIR